MTHQSPHFFRPLQDPSAREPTNSQLDCGRLEKFFGDLQQSPPSFENSITIIKDSTITTRKSRCE